MTGEDIGVDIVEDMEGVVGTEEVVDTEGVTEVDRDTNCVVCPVRYSLCDIARIWSMSLTVCNEETMACIVCK